jgi:hypothetical protein
MTDLSVLSVGAIDPFAAASPAKNNTAIETQSFADELATSFTEARSMFGISPNSTPLTTAAPMSPTPSQSNVVSQNSVATGDFSPRSVLGLNALVPAASSTVTPPPPSAPTPADTDTDSLMASDDAYWAAQPAAVQQLRNMDSSQRDMVGTQLASEGYTIDVPIMIWGEDPTLTTQLRQSFGYTWVPSALQAPLTAAPGITGLGITPYDPNNPPTGSILVG